jgi:hypothetical protein
MTTYIPPTVLYIKQHSITKLKYFGKTTRDPLKYKGSGVDWRLHLKENGSEHIITLWVSEPYTDKDAIMEFALAFSRDNNIVESELWANRKIENGLDGGSYGPSKKKGKPSGKKGEPSKKKGKTYGKQQNPSKKPSHMIGKTPSDATRNKQSASHMGKNSPRKGKTYGKQQNPAPKITCPHCGKTGGSVMTRYHFDNCKKKPQQ